MSQGSCKVLVYAEKSRAQCRMLPDLESPLNQVWLRKLFLKGLAAPLSGMCQVDQERKEWRVIDDLITYACIEEDNSSRSLPSPPTQKPGDKRPHLAALHGENSQRKWAYSFPSQLLDKPFDKEVNQACFQHGTCFRCRNVQYLNNLCPNQGPPVPPYGEPSCCPTSSDFFWKEAKAPVCARGTQAYDPILAEQQKE